jgi:hypothetical protein
MGGKHTSRRQHLYIYITCGLILVSWLAGCTHLAEKKLDQQRLLKARRLIEKGDFEAALNRYRYLRLNSPRSFGDIALYQMGLIYSHPDNPNRDLSKALAAFNTILYEYRNSPLRLEADIWMALIEEYQYNRDQVSKLFDKYDKLEKTLGQKETQIDALHIEMDQMRQKIKSLQMKLTQLRTQMERLKQIDLGIDAKKRQARPEKLIEEGANE